MIRARLVCACLAVLPATGLHAEDFLDRVDDALTFSLLGDSVRMRVSGTLDLEYYHLDLPATGLLDTQSPDFFNPRLSLFLDAQIGTHFYAFAQARADRGYDPGTHPAEMRLDEYALRYTPWDDGRLSIQVGKFSSVIGNWMERHLSWDNPFITAPMPYDHITAVSDSEVHDSARDFLSEAGSLDYDYNPVLWGACYSTGMSVSGRLGKLEYAAEMKNAAPSSRPESWSATDTDFSHPTFSGRFGYRPNTLWNLGFSASRGPYLRAETAASLPAGTGISDYSQTLLAQDISFAWRHLQLWAEFYQARFDVPNAGAVETFAYYLEAKYKFTPEFFGALRWNQQLFSKISDGAGGSARWSNDAWRIDAALGYRFTAHTQLKVQYSFEQETTGARRGSSVIATQFTLRF